MESETKETHVPRVGDEGIIIGEEDNEQLVDN